MTAIEAIIRKYSDEAMDVSEETKRKMFLDVLAYTEQEESLVVFDRRGFDLSTEYNLQAYFGFENKHVALIKEEDLYRKMVMTLLERGLLVDYLEGFERDWVADLFEDAPSYTAVLSGGEIKLQEVREASMNIEGFIEEVQEENLLHSLCRFLECDEYQHWGQGWYVDTSYRHFVEDDPRQLKLFEANS